MKSSSRRRNRRWALWCCLGAFALLVSTLNAQSIWWDEGISLHLASLSWREIIDNRAANIHPPLYFFVLKVWTGAVGNTPFTGRYLSALATTLLPAVAYGFVRPRFGAHSARAAAFLLAFAPPFVVYGQETRAYAFLPLGVMALWAYVWPVASGRRVHQGSGLPRHVVRSVTLGLVQAGLLLLHYAGALAVGVAALGYASRWLRNRRDGDQAAARQVAREWSASAVVTLFAVLPWGARVLSRGLGGPSRQAGLGNALSEPVPAGYVAGLLGVFHTAGLPEALGRPHLARLALWLGLLTALGTVFALCRSKKRYAFAGLVALWLVPFLAAPAIWTLSPQSHPRYLYAFVVGGWLLAGAVITASAVPQALRLGLLGGVLVSNLLGLTTYFADPEVARSDVRAAAAYIRQTAIAGDVALVPHTDWSLEQYDLGRASLEMVAQDTGRPDGQTRLALDTAPGGRVFVLDYARGALDPRGAVRAALCWGGVLTARREFDGVAIEVYELHDAAGVTPCQAVVPVCAAGSDLCLTGLALPPAPISGSAVPVALCWEKGAGTVTRYGVAVRLHGPKGDFIAADHDLLLDASLAPTDLWSAQAVASYHLLPLPVGALPEAHSIEISLYDALRPEQSVVLAGAQLSGPAAAATIGEVTPAVSPWHLTSLYGLGPLPDQPVLQLTPSLRLTGARLDREVVRPGETFYVSLSWEPPTDSAASAQPRIELTQDGAVVAAAYSGIHALALPPDRPALETLAVSVPPDAASGEGDLVLRVDDFAAVIGSITIEGTAHLFEPPDLDYPVGASAGTVAALLGFDLDPGAGITAGEPVTVTLVWRAEAGAA
ncbi:MAG: glycosyltransferase family 39 protein, partial [Anaerolineae bacterium]|nr:glycosyltransferase family 39 protein [Anaerolineae bacterium]